MQECVGPPQRPAFARNQLVPTVLAVQTRVLEHLDDAERPLHGNVNAADLAGNTTIRTSP